MKDLPPHVQLGILSRDYVMSRALHAIAHLGIADHMSNQFLDVEKIAHSSSTIPELLDRVLTFLSSYGLFLKKESSYALTELSSTLRSDHPHSMQKVLSMVDESWWQAFAHLETTLKTGRTGFNIEKGMSFFDFLKTHPDKKERFQTGISQLATMDDQSIIQAYPFNSFESMTNIGPENSELLKELQKNYPDMILNSFNPQDEFTSLPQSQAYIIKGILHDLNDNQIIKTLSLCDQHMPKNSTLILAEQVIPDTNFPHTNKTMDIVMMVLVGGQQRTLKQWCNLILKINGFQLKHTYPTQGIYTLMEFGHA